MLSEETVLRRLRAIKQSSQADRINGRILTMATIARRANLNRTFLHGLLNGQHKLGPTARQRLSDVFKCIDNPRIRPVDPAISPTIEIRFSVEKWLN
jgi:hypothetical protein